jgi:hypothetical protein
MKLKEAMQCYGTSEGIQKEWEVRRGGEPSQGQQPSPMQPHPEVGQFQQTHVAQSPIGNHTLYQSPGGSQVAVTQMPNNQAMVHTATPGPQMKPGQIMKVHPPSQGGKAFLPPGSKGGGSKMPAGKGFTPKAPAGKMKTAFSGTHGATNRFLQKSFGIKHAGFTSKGGAKQKGVGTTGNWKYRPAKGLSTKVKGQKRGGYAVQRWPLALLPGVQFK